VCPARRWPQSKAAGAWELKLKASTLRKAVSGFASEKRIGASSFTTGRTRAKPRLLSQARRKTAIELTVTPTMFVS
jgi:hypothetical protein